MKINIWKLNNNTKTSDLQTLFERFGKIKNMEHVLDSASLVEIFLNSKIGI